MSFEQETILEALGEGIIAVDSAMTVVYINKLAEELLKLNGQELLGKSFVLAKLPYCLQLLLQAQSKEKRCSSIFTREEPPKRRLELTAVPTATGVLLIIQDQTRLHHVVELGRDFIANSSHELKTPITIIRGFAETLYEHPELSREQSLEITEKIVKNCERMEKIVKNLLQLSDIDEGPPRMEECEVEELLSHCKQMALMAHPNASITLDIQSGIAPILIDKDLFELALTNLLDNAIKYSKDRATVRVEAKQRPEETEIAVSDRGIGIPKEALKHIFERFYSVNKALSRSLGGAGLGLSIVERIVEKHGGAIRVTSELGMGSTFAITLPRLHKP